MVAVGHLWAYHLDTFFLHWALLPPVSIVYRGQQARIKEVLIPPLLPPLFTVYRGGSSHGLGGRRPLPPASNPNLGIIITIYIYILLLFFVPNLFPHGPPATAYRGTVARGRVVTGHQCRARPSPFNTKSFFFFGSSGRGPTSTHGRVPLSSPMPQVHRDNRHELSPDHLPVAGRANCSPPFRPPDGGCLLPQSGVPSSPNFSHNTHSQTLTEHLCSMVYPCSGRIDPRRRPLRLPGRRLRLLSSSLSPH